MRYFTLGLLFALNLSLVSSGPLLKTNGIDNPPQSEFGPAYDPGGIDNPPESGFGPLYDPDG